MDSLPALSLPWDREPELPLSSQSLLLSEPLEWDLPCEPDEPCDSDLPCDSEPPFGPELPCDSEPPFDPELPCDSEPPCEPELPLESLQELALEAPAAAAAEEEAPTDAVLVISDISSVEPGAAVNGLLGSTRDWLCALWPAVKPLRPLCATKL